MSITFNDKREAIEYIKHKNSEGYTTEILRDGNKYIVNIGEYIGKGQIKAGHFIVGEEHIFVFPNKASSTTKLHEIGHKNQKQLTEETSLEEFATREIDAEKFAYNKMGRKLGYNALKNIALVLKEDKNATGKQACEITIEEAEKQGIMLSNEEHQKMLEELESY